jgi:GGDEF domain-containing protein
MVPAAPVLPVAAGWLVPLEASRIVGRIREGFPPAKLIEDGIALTYTFSAGIVEAFAGDDRSSILRPSDRALYAAKREGRNCTRVGLAAAD